MVPITSHAKGYPFEVAISTKSVVGVALADHLKNLDWRARGVTFAGKVPAGVLEEAKAKLVALLGF
jgi:mRNA interferase MazF